MIGSISVFFLCSVLAEMKNGIMMTLFVLHGCGGDGVGWMECRISKLFTSIVEERSGETRKS